ncbi:multiubiquitin domain-containing protein [Mesorhizobium sp. WSM2561]|uniref:multiubiquitin domain-containing protein n=1 Tax=Mesorhizobium sp. WSM2561 TaxID=1040985 RepID=UPI000484ED7D|nr:multiubiquitin domain-containing protein [Mesorhizobium sp. WSM2561]
MSDNEHGDKHDDKHDDNFEFYIDGTLYTTDQHHLTGLQIKTIGQVQGNFLLYEEAEGDKPDMAVSDGQTVTFNRGHVRHFFSVPPATFGWN